MGLLPHNKQNPKHKGKGHTTQVIAQCCFGGWTLQSQAQHTWLLLSPVLILCILGSDANLLRNRSLQFSENTFHLVPTTLGYHLHCHSREHYMRNKDPHFIIRVLEAFRSKAKKFILWLCKGRNQPTSLGMLKESRDHIIYNENMSFPVILHWLSIQDATVLHFT